MKISTYHFIFIGLISLFFTCPLFSAADTLFAGGSGTEVDPFLISTAEHLDNVRSELDAHFLQVNDISLDTLPYNEGLGWEPIGSCDNSLEGIPFSGYYDGGNFKIFNLYINRHDSIPAGLFGCTQEATVKNLELVDVNLSTSFWTGSTIGYNFSGNSTRVENIHVNGTAQFGDKSGGLIGQGDSLIVTGCSADINIDGGRDLGGIVGEITNGGVYHSQTTGNLTAGYSIGGIAGLLNRGYMNGNISTMTINSTGEEVGGIVGDMNRSTLDSCSYIGNLISTERECGGISGIMFQSTLNYCYSEGYLESQGTGGGMVGNMASQSHIYQCSSTMTINAIAGGGGGLAGVAGNGTISSSSFDGIVGNDLSGRHFGGIVGFVGLSIIINDVTSSGLIQGSQNVGGIVGNFDTNSRITNASSDATILANSNAGGIVGEIRNNSRLDSIQFTGTVEGIDAIGGILGMSSGFSTNALSNAINNGSVEGEIEVGGIVGRLEIDLNITNAINNSDISGISEVGGIVGSIRMAGTISDTTYISNVLNTGNISGETNIGGIVGEYRHIGVFNDMHSSGNISGTNYVGGYFGYFESTEGIIELTDLHFSESVSGESHVGGIFGKAHLVHLNQISSTASVTGNSSVGGIAGELDSTVVELSYFNGIIDGGDFMGGLAGQLNRSEVHNTYVRGTMISPQGMAGGIAGLGQNSIVANSYAAVDLVQDQILNGIFSELQQSEVLRSYYIPGEDPMQGNGDENGILSSEEAMTYPYSSEIYEDWDFTEIWSFDYDYSVNEGFPYLSWQADSERGDFFVEITVVEIGLGSVSGIGYYDEGESVSVVAEVHDPENYEFIAWQDEDGSVLSENLEYRFTMPGNNFNLFAVFDMISGIRNIEDYGFNVFPNPASHKISIMHSEVIHQLNIINSNGHLMESEQPNAQSVDLNISELSPGFYILAIKDSNGWAYRKISIAR